MSAVFPGRRGVSAGDKTVSTGVTVSMDDTDQEECGAVDVSQRIKQFQSRINKITIKSKSRSKDNNNNNSTEYDNRNIVKTRSKSLPGKSLVVKYEVEEVRNIEEAAAPAPAPAPAPRAGSSNTSSSSEQQEEIVSLPSVKMLASKFSHQSRSRRIDSKVRSPSFSWQSNCIKIVNFIEFQSSCNVEIKTDLQ